MLQTCVKKLDDHMRVDQLYLFQFYSFRLFSLLLINALSHLTKFHKCIASKTEAGSRSWKSPSTSHIHIHTYQRISVDKLRAQKYKKKIKTTGEYTIEISVFNENSHRVVVVVVVYWIWRKTPMNASYGLS